MLNKNETSVLKELSEKSPLTSSVISEKLDIHQCVVLKALGNLLNEGFVETSGIPSTFTYGNSERSAGTSDFLKVDGDDWNITEIGKIEIEKCI